MISLHKLQFRSYCSYFMNENVRNFPKFPQLRKAVDLELRPTSKTQALLITLAVQFLFHIGFLVCLFYFGYYMVVLRSIWINDTILETASKYEFVFLNLEKVIEMKDLFSDKTNGHLSSKSCIFYLVMGVFM